MPSSADECRTNGWTVGTILEGVEDRYADRIVITAIGEQEILARRIAHCSNVAAVPQKWEPRDDDEGLWTLDCREWRKVD